MNRESMVFQYDLPKRICFGLDEFKRIPDLLKEMKARRVLITTDGIIARQNFFDILVESLKAQQMEFHVFDEVAAEPTIENIDRIGGVAREFAPQAIIGIGGGSSLDAAKGACILALNPGSVAKYLGVGNCPDQALPTILIPTTSGTGSEVTGGAVFTQTLEDSSLCKVFIKGPKLYATVALVDPMLTVTMPPATTAATGLDAFCHALESYVSFRSNACSELFAFRSIEYVGKYLRRAVLNGKDIEARYYMALSSVYGGLAFSGTGCALIHGLSQALGAEYHIPHGLGNAIMLTPVSRFNYPAAEQKYAKVAQLLGENTQGLSLNKAAKLAVDAIERLTLDLGIPRRLSEIGVSIPREKVETLVRSQLRAAPFLFYNNPRQASAEEASELIMDIM